MKLDPGAHRGTRDELISELSKAAEGWSHFGKPLLADQARDGASRLQSGETSVQVGHVEYHVTE